MSLNKNVNTNIYTIYTIIQVYSVCFLQYLDVKLQIPLVHLSGNHTLNHVHRYQLVALIGWAEDIVCVTFLNLDIEEPEKKMQVCSQEK